MLSLSELSQDEIRYICKHIPLPMVRNYFQAQPKEFAKIRPGFRPDKISDADTLNVLVKNHKQPFVFTFLEKIIKDWFFQIDANVSKLENEGYSHGEALLKTIPESFFCENVELYFKLVNEKYSEDYFGIFRDALTLIKKEECKESDFEEGDDSVEELSNYAEQIEEANKTVQQLKLDLSRAQEENRQLEKLAVKLKEDLENGRSKLEKKDDELKKTYAHISELESQLDYYRRIDSYSDKEFEHTDYMQFQHISIGQISHDYNGQVWINRIADIVDGEIIPFCVNESEPRYFSNRDRLYWKNGPDKEGTIGIWNWKADVRDTDFTKDFITCEYNSNSKIIEIVELSQCKNINELSALLIDGSEIDITCSKVLFVFTNSNGVKEGLLCGGEELENSGKKVRVRSSVYMLPCFHIRNNDVINIDRIKVYHKMNLGTPHSIVRIRTPYDAVKSMLLDRVTITALRDYDLSKKEAQHCKRLLEELPTETLIQELSDAYECSEEEAKGYIDDFIEYAGTYLSAEDFDMRVLSSALSRNSDLIKLCKEELSAEWKKDNDERIASAKNELDQIRVEAEMKKNEIQETINKQDNLNIELENIKKQIVEKEDFASEVEKNITLRIEKAKENAADFISQMAFLSPTTVSIASDSDKNDTISVIHTCIESENEGEIDDIDTLGEELAENFMSIGYNEATAVDMSRMICFCISTNTILVIGENSFSISKCIATTMGCKELSEIPVYDRFINCESFKSVLAEHKGNHVLLLHGVLDGYSVTSFNTISRILSDNHKHILITLSLEGIQPHMVPPGVWNHAMFVDGDKGLTEFCTNDIKSFNVSVVYDRELEMSKIKEKRKQLENYSSLLSNIQISRYSNFLAFYDVDLNQSSSVLSQIITSGKSQGKENELRSMFVENGAQNGEKLLLEMM